MADESSADVGKADEGREGNRVHSGRGEDKRVHGT
jgi:hypothetical protein